VVHSPLLRHAINLLSENWDRRTKKSVNVLAAAGNIVNRREGRYLGSMRLRVAELLEERGMTAYALAKHSGDRISVAMAYRLAGGEFERISARVLDALCDVFELEDVGLLFERQPRRRKTR
jgi:DNA-binding Xre family transcriptional regulator